MERTFLQTNVYVDGDDSLRANNEGMVKTSVDQLFKLNSFTEYTVGIAVVIVAHGLDDANGICGPDKGRAERHVGN